MGMNGRLRLACSGDLELVPCYVRLSVTMQRHENVAHWYAEELSVVYAEPERLFARIQ